MKANILSLILFLYIQSLSFAQNGIVGDGFGGRLWYDPTNYSVGSYSGFTVCDKVQDNQLIGWGSNGYGEMGTSPTFGSAIPVEIPNMHHVKYYTTGYVMAAIKQDNTGWVWGFSDFNYAPTQVISDVKFVDAGVDFVSFIKNDGTVWSLGNNNGTFGDNMYGTNSVTPVQMLGISNAVRVACSYGVNYILTSDGKVYTCGISMNSLGLQDSTINSSTAPQQMAVLDNIVDIKATSAGLLALDAAGDVYIHGVMYGTFSYPQKITELSNIVAISGMCDGMEFLALDANKNAHSYLGLSPQLVASDVIDVLAGETFSYIVKSDGSLWGKGWSNGGSIWLNLPDMMRDNYTLIDVNQVPELCPVQIDHAAAIDCKTIEVLMYNGTPPYSYSIGSGTQSTPVFTNLNPGVYTVTVTDNVGAVTNFTVDLQANTQGVQASFLMSPAVTSCLTGSSIVFLNTSTTNASIYWSVDGDSLSQDSTFTHLFSSTGTHCVELIAEKNFCVDTAEVCIEVVDAFLAFPNIFTPNGDGDNDVFTLNPNGSINFYATIVNRWENVVAELTNSAPVWDGLIHGEKAAEGEYFITVDYSIEGGETLRYSGFLHLVR